MTSLETKNQKEYLDSLTKEILALKKEKKAVILAHYYQRMEIQEVADLLGDSLGLSKAAKDIRNAEMLVFSGVYFMAETAKILNPEMKVLIPNPNAGCPLADQCSVEDIQAAKKKHPNVPVVVYVNTTAKTKAVADVTCTSSNADTVIRNMQKKKVIFGPDSNLARFVQDKVSGVEIIPVPEDGHCYVHRRFDVDTILELKKQNPGAVVMAHPECNYDVQEMADYVGSTSGMLQFGSETAAKVIIVATEKGLVDRMNKNHPEKDFILAKNTAVCANMKKITLEHVRDALLKEQHEVIVPKEIAEKARKAIERMLELS